MKASQITPTTAKAVGIWIRVSTEDQARGESPEAHKERAKMYAAAKGWTVKQIYDLAGVSGKTVMKHPEAQRMLKDLRSGHITGLIFSKLARLARNTKELLDFADIFKSCNADLISLQESIDTSTPAGRLFYTMIAAMAQWEREEIGERIRASFATRAKLGKQTSGGIPYGYVWRDGKLVIDKEQAAIVKLIFDLFLEHRRKGVVSRILNERGYRTRIGKKWHDMGVHRVLTHTSSKGIHVYNRYRKTGAWTWEYKPESEWGHLHVESIVSEDVWNEVNQILEKHVKREHRPGRTPKQLFTGFIFCHCGSRMYVMSSVPKYICKNCQNKIPIMDIEAIFYDEIKSFFINPDKIATHLQTINATLDEKRKLLELHKREIQKVREEMEKTHRLYLDGQIPMHSYSSFHKPQEDRLAQLLNESPRLEGELDALNVNSLSVDEVINEAQQLYAKWPALPLEEKRKIVQIILDRITIGKGEIDITLSCLPSSQETANSQQLLTSGCSC